MLDTVAELEDINQIVSILTQNDIRLREDQKMLQNEKSLLASAMEIAKSENDPLKSTMKELQEKHYEVSTRVSTYSS